MKKKLKHIIGLLLFIALCTSCASVGSIKKDVSPEVKRDFYLINASKSYYQQDFATAHKLLEKAIDIDENCDACYFLLARIAAQEKGQIQNATQIAKMAFKIDSTNIWYAQQFAQMSEYAGDMDSAIKAYQYLSSKPALQEEAYYNLASLYLKQGKYDKSLEIYDSIQQKYGFGDRLMISRQNMYEVKKDKAGSLQNALDFYNRDTTDARASALLGEIYARNNNLDTALIYFEKAYDLQPEFPSALFGLAELYRIKKNANTSFKYIFEIAANKNIGITEKIDYFSQVLPFWAQLNQQKRIDKLFDILKEDYANEWAFNQLYTSFLINMGKKEEAEKILNEELQKNKQNSIAWDMKIMLLYFTGDKNDLLKVIDTAILSVEDNTTFISRKSMVLYEIKRYQEAIDNLQKALKVNKDSAFMLSSYELLGELYHAMGNKKKAFRYYDLVVTIDSTNIGALNNYAYYLSLEGKQLKKALAMSGKTIDKEPNNATFLDTYGWILYQLGRNADAKPIFRRAMLSGGRDSAVILDHYGDVLFKLKEFDIAILYWEDALSKKDVKNADEIKKKVANCKKVKEKK